MDKKIIYGFLIVSLLLIVGCTGGSGGKNPITDVDVRKGTDGLTMEFTKNAPPQRVFEDSEFPIALKLRNRGAFDIKPVEVVYYEEQEFEDDETYELYIIPVKKIKTVEGKLVFGFETTFVDLSEKIKEEHLKSEKKGLENERSQLKDKIRMLEEEIIFLQDDQDTDAVKDRLNEIVEELSEFNDRLDEIIVELIEIEEKLNAIKNDLKLDIKGKSIFSPNGDQELITINAKTKKIGAQSETQPSTILATACYPYKTIFGASVCIDTDIYGIRRERKACEISDLTFSKGQGAPVAITKIETRMLPDVDEEKIKPHFIIHIENRGNGEVIGLEKVQETCTNKALDYTAFNTILITASLSGKPLDCRLDRESPRAGPPPPAPATIRLRDKVSLVRCILEVPDDELIDISRDAYVTPLSIELDYGYTFTISKDIIIEKILTY